MNTSVGFKGKVVHGTIWSAMERFSIMGIQIVCTFVVARYLSPTDFGLIGILVVFTAIGNTLVDSGFGQTLIREKDVSNLDYTSVFYLNVILSIIVYALLYVSSGYIADFYKEQSLKYIARITFLIFPLNGLSVVQNSILVRCLEFKKLFYISFCAAIISSVISIILAIYYQNVWALVFQNIFQYGLKFLFLWFSSKWYPSFCFSYSSIRKYLNLSANLLVTGLIGSIFNNIYMLVIGRVYSASDLGFYGQADRIRMAISGSSTDIIQRVTYPILSSLNNSGGNVKIAYKKIIFITVYVVSSVMALFMGISVDLFELIMGNAVWRIAGVYFFILCINGALYPLHSINQNILLVKGMGHVLLRLEIARRCIMIVILCITIHFNVLFFVCGNAIYAFLLLFLNLYYCGKPINYNLSEQLKDILPIYIRALIIVVCMLIVNCILKDCSIDIRIMCSLCIGLIMFYLLYFRTRYMNELISLFQQFRKDS